MGNRTNEIVFLGHDLKYASTLCISFPTGADFYAIVEMSKKIAHIPGMLRVSLFVDLSRYDWVGTFPGKKVEKKVEDWLKTPPTFSLFVLYEDKTVYQALHDILFHQYKDEFPDLDVQSGA